MSHLLPCKPLVGPSVCVNAPHHAHCEFHWRLQSGKRRTLRISARKTAAGQTPQGVQLLMVDSYGMGVMCCRMRCAEEGITAYTGTGFPSATGTMTGVRQAQQGTTSLRDPLSSSGRSITMT